MEPLLTVRNRINSGEVVGTRALIGGNIIGMGGPFSHYMMTGWPVTNKGMRYGGWVHPEIQGRINALWEAGVGPSLLAAEPEEVSEIMREYIARGVDFIKVAVSGHALGDVEPLMFEMAALKAMKEETRRAGIPFTTHTFTNASLRVAIELEPDLLVHPNVMSIPYAYSTPRQQEAFEKLAKLASQKKIHSALMMIPSKAQTEIVMNWDPEAHRESPGVNELIWNRKLHTSYESYEKISQGVKVWLDAGVPYTIATDQGPESTDVGPTVWGRLGRAHFDRMEALQALGEDPADILIAATRNGAAAYNLDDRLGTLETGKIADILILDANPHEDIANLRKINTIIKDGRIIDRDDLPEVKVLDYDPEATWPY